MDLKQSIINHSKSIGIDLIGFTDIEPFEDLRQILIQRKEKEYLSGFEEKDIELRVNPRKTMNNAKSIIVIGMSYYIDEEEILESNPPKYYGQLARTAWGKDYHLVLGKQLNKLAEFISDQYKDFEYKAFVDTGPLVDRYLANRAGLGFYGYNSTIINNDFGSWIFLGYMITNISIEKDKPLNNKTCIGCNLCIEKCPTSAIKKNFGFNANKCLSNILQQKREIPENIRKAIGKRIYGCDICQDVCPHNINIKEMTTKEFIPKELSSKVDLLQLIKLSNKEYKTLFEKNASGWRGKKVLQRNGIIALSNYKDRDIIPYLEPLLEDVRPDIREIAKWAIDKLNSNE